MRKALLILCLFSIYFTSNCDKKNNIKPTASYGDSNSPNLLDDNFLIAEGKGYQIRNSDLGPQMKDLIKKKNGLNN